MVHQVEIWIKLIKSLNNIKKNKRMNHIFMISFWDKVNILMKYILSYKILSQMNSFQNLLFTLITWDNILKLCKIKFKISMLKEILFIKYLNYF